MDFINSHFSFDAIGTHWLIDIYYEISKEAEVDLLVKIMERIGIFDKVYSRFRSDSLITEISLHPGKFLFPEDSQELFSFYKKMYEMTGGLVTPLIGQALVDAGYDHKYTLVQKKELEKPFSWEEAISFSYPYLDVHKAVILDFGAAGKGYLVDLVGSVIESQGINSYCVDAGGDILYKSSKAKVLPVGLEHPEDTSKAIGVVNLLNQSLCGSAGNRRKWPSRVAGKQDFNHMINPITLSSPKDITAVWVTTKDTMTADGLATCLFFVSPEVLRKEYAFEYFILKSDSSFIKSQNFPGEIFVQ